MNFSILYLVIPSPSAKKACIMPTDKRIPLFYVLILETSGSSLPASDGYLFIYLFKIDLLYLL